MDREDIIEQLQDWFRERNGDEIDPNEHYLDAGRIDSFDVIDLVAFVEQRFDLRLQAEDFQGSAFHTLHGLAGLLHARLAHA